MISKDELIANYKEVEQLSKKYEDIESFESAYLIKWQFIENTVKKIAERKRKEDVINALKLWLDYYEDNNNTKPDNSKKIDLVIQSNSLPNENFLKKCFKTDMPALYITLNTDHKYRKKRNKIAHKFEPFHKVETYREYSEQLDNTITELINNIEQAYI